MSIGNITRSYIPIVIICCLIQKSITLRNFVSPCAIFVQFDHIYTIYQEVTPMPTETLPKIAAAYIRVSTDDQVEYSLGQK